MHINGFLLSTLLATALASASSQLLAQQPDPGKEYAACMTLARTAPEQGFEKATAWQGVGGGDAARHCAAVSLIGLGQFTEAAKRLEALADVAQASAGFKAQILGQAGQAWLLAGNPKQADAALSTAIKLDSQNPHLLIDRSQAAAALQAYGNAIRDLDRALEVDPASADALVFRASAYRQLKDDASALRDVEKALALDSAHPEGLLERGILRRLQKNDAGARTDWLKVIELAPESPAAASAQANLQKLDGGIK